MKDKQIIGMVHLKALPSSPRNTLSIEEIYNFAKEDLIALQENGASAAIVENFNDIPYGLNNDRYALYTMCSIAARLKEIATIPLGINIHFNCVEDEIAMATACDYDFVRVECYVENRVGLFGVAEAKAAIVERLRKSYNSKVKVYADVNVKHSHPLVPGVELKESIEQAIESGADKIIITGLKTGDKPKIEDVKEAKNYAKDTPIILGSGINKDNIKDYLEYIDGCIIGTSFKKDGDVLNGIDGRRVRELMDIVHSI